MRLYSAVGLASFSYAFAQSLSSSTGLIFDPFSSSDFASATFLTTGSLASTSILATSATASSTSSTVSTTLATTPTTGSSTIPSTSAASLTTSYSPSGTLVLLTDSSDASLSTLASTATPTVSPAAAANGGTSGYRSAVIALAAILGALVVGLAILIPFLVRRRRLRQSNQQRSSSSSRPVTESRKAAKTEPKRSKPWLGFFRREPSAEQPSTEPKQQYATVTTQPLMSEGSPMYGFNSPREARPAPLFSGASAGRRRDSPTDTSGPRRNETTSANLTAQPEAAISAQEAAQTIDRKRQDTDHARQSSDHDVGNPYVDDNPKTPNLLQGRSAPEQKQRQAYEGQDDNDQSQYAPLASHPVDQLPHRSNRDTLEVPVDNEDRQTERSASIPRDGFANAIAGLGIDPDNPTDQAVSEQSVIAEPATSTVDESRTDRPVSGVDKLQPANLQDNLTTPKSQASRFPPKLNIPQSLIPGRQRSKKTRFSIAGNEEVSPTSEPWHDADEAERGHYRRPSTVSPISPERNERRTQSEVLAPRRSGKRGGHREPNAATMSAPAASSSQAVRSSHKNDRSAMAPGVHHIQSGSVPHAKDQAHLEVPKPQRASVPAGPVKRKPTPLDLAALMRKPLPPHPIPTSKYNQAARQSLKSQQTQSATQTSRYTPKYENADDMSSKLQGGQSSRQPRVATPTVYDTRAKPFGEMHNTSVDKGKGKAPRPLSEAVDNDTIISSYMQPHSRAPPMQMQAHLQPQQQTQAGPATLNKRDTVQFFEDPGNQEYARVYGSYYAQPSPVQFASPISPQAPQFPYPPVAAYGYSHQAPQYQERPRYLQPPPQGGYQPQPQQMQPQPQFQTQPYNDPRYHNEQYPYVKPVYQHQQQQQQQPPPPPSSMNTRPMKAPPTLAPPMAAIMASDSWRDSQQDAWRDSLSRSGSDPTSNSGSANGAASGTGVATSNASSGGGGGPGLWGSPGFFGVER